MYAPRGKQVIFLWNSASSDLLICSHTHNDSYNGGGVDFFFFFYWYKWENMLKCSKWVKSFIENDEVWWAIWNLWQRGPMQERKKGAKAQGLLQQHTLQLQLSTLLPSFSCYPVQVCHFRKEILGQKGVTSINKARNSSFLCGQLHYPAICTLKAQSHMFWCSLSDFEIITFPTPPHLRNVIYFNQKDQKISKS